jgi:hypothetical protein
MGSRYNIHKVPEVAKGLFADTNSRPNSCVHSRVENNESSNNYLNSSPY